MKHAIAALWPPPPLMTCSTGDCWAELTQSVAKYGPDKGNVVVVGSDPSWWTLGQVNQAMKDAVASLLGTGCTVLGYVPAREQLVSNGPFVLRDASAISADYDTWMNAYSNLPVPGGQQLSIDGIYFDLLILPGYDANPGQGCDPAPSGNTSNDAAKGIVAGFRQAHPGATVMVLAGNTQDDWVVGDPVTDNAPDYALMFEQNVDVYDGGYAASCTQDSNMNKPIPSWWKDPAHQHRITHTVHTTGPGDRWQRALGLAVERNAGHLFLLDTNPDTQGGYNHLPPYWQTAVDWMHSYETPYVGLSTELLLRAAHLWAGQQGSVHGWPNGEQAWYWLPSTADPANFELTQVRGTYRIDPASNASVVVTHETLPGNPPLYDVAGVWAATHTWALSRGHMTAWPTFNDVGPGQYELVHVPAGTPWLTIEIIDITATVPYEQPPPTFAEPYALTRNVHRVAQDRGHLTALPTFRATDDPVHGTWVDGRHGYEVAFFHQGAPLLWADVLGTTYGQVVGV